MKRKKFRFTGWIPAVAMSLLTLMALGDSRQPPAFRFEPEPHAPLDAARSRHAKIYLRTSSIYLLSVIEQGGRSQLGMSLSSDGGDSFEPPVIISAPEAQVSSHGENSPSLVINGIEFYALWEQNNDTGGTDLMFARSLRFGRQFDAPIRVTDKTKPSTNAFSNLGVAPDGSIYALWLDGRDPNLTMAGTSHLYMTKSTDKGATFGKNFPIARDVCPCCRPAIAFGSKGEIFIAWRGVADGDVRDIMFAASTDGGKNFTQPRRVASDKWKISGCPHSGPSLAVNNRRLYAAWHSEGEGSNAGIRVCWSDDGGASFSEPIIASAGVLDTNHPALSVSEDGLTMLVFQGRDPREKESWGPISPYLCEIGHDGSVSPPIRVPGNHKSIAYPAIAAGTVGRAFISWTESTEKGQNVLLIRARKPAADSLHKPVTEKSSVSNARNH